VAKSINDSHYNPRYLKDLKLPDNVKATVELSHAGRSNLIILAIPSHTMRDVLTRLKPFMGSELILVGATKGIEVETGKRMSEVARDVLGEAARYVCLSGPSFAREVVVGQPTAVVAAGLNREDCRTVQEQLSFENLRIYTNDDLVGVELGGAVKNVIAIAAGMVTGLGLGSNSLAALITRGLAEITRLAMREGGQLATLMGLAGLGDLVLTCTGSLSRNRFVGEELAKGRSVDDICNDMHEVAEGIVTTKSAWRLSRERGVDTPITDEVYAVLYEQKAPREAAAELMTRPLRDEF
jgi:glycerol-3-phosphate dehydrogenase (NAD(P)+)